MHVSWCPNDGQAVNNNDSLRLCRFAQLRRTLAATASSACWQLRPSPSSGLASCRRWVRQSIISSINSGRTNKTPQRASHRAESFAAYDRQAQLIRFVTVTCRSTGSRAHIHAATTTTERVMNRSHAQRRARRRAAGRPGTLPAEEWLQPHAAPRGRVRCQRPEAR